MAASEPKGAPGAAYVYMVRCAGGQLYTGWTSRPAARLRAHQQGRGAKYTRAHPAVAFAYLEQCPDRSAALRREAALKKLTKAQKEALCAGWQEFARSFPGSGLALSVTFGDTSPIGGGTGVSVNFALPAMGPLCRKRAGPAVADSSSLTTAPR